MFHTNQKKKRIISVIKRKRTTQEKKKETIKERIKGTIQELKFDKIPIFYVKDITSQRENKKEGVGNV